MNTLSKTTLNYANKRNLSLQNEDGQLWISEESNDCEPLVIYNEESDGWHFKGNVYLDRNVVEELPAWIKDEKHLRQVIAFLADNLPS